MLLWIEQFYLFNIILFIQLYSYKMYYFHNIIIYINWLFIDILDLLHVVGSVNPFNMPPAVIRWIIQCHPFALCVREHLYSFKFVSSRECVHHWIQVHCIWVRVWVREQLPKIKITWSCLQWPVNDLIALNLSCIF